MILDVSFYIISPKDSFKESYKRQIMDSLSSFTQKLWIYTLRNELRKEKFEFNSECIQS